MDFGKEVNAVANFLGNMTPDEAVEMVYNYSQFFQIPVTDRAVGFVFSRQGFTVEAEDYCREMGFACSEDERWLDS